MRVQVGIAISVVKNSVAQIAVGALLVSALAVWQITGDGEAAAFEGWVLVAIYVVLATVTLYE